MSIQTCTHVQTPLFSCGSIRCNNLLFMWKGKKENSDMIQTVGLMMQFPEYLWVYLPSVYWHPCLTRSTWTPHVTQVPLACHYQYNWLVWHQEDQGSLRIVSWKTESESVLKKKKAKIIHSLHITSWRPRVHLLLWRWVVPSYNGDRVSHLVKFMLVHYTLPTVRFPQDWTELEHNKDH